MRRLTAAFSLVFLGCASSADDVAPDDNAGAGNSSSDRPCQHHQRFLGRGRAGDWRQRQRGSGNQHQRRVVRAAARWPVDPVVVRAPPTKDGGVVVGGIVVTVTPKSTAVMTSKSLRSSSDRHG